MIISIYNKPRINLYVVNNTLKDKQIWILCKWRQKEVKCRVNQIFCFSRQVIEVVSLKISDLSQQKNVRDSPWKETEVGDTPKRHLVANPDVWKLSTFTHMHKLSAVDFKSSTQIIVLVASPRSTQLLTPPRLMTGVFRHQLLEVFLSNLSPFLMLQLPSLYFLWGSSQVTALARIFKDFFWNQAVVLRGLL